MKLSELLRELGQAVEAVSGEAVDAHVHACMLLQESMEAFSPETLYYYKGGGFPDLPEDTAIAILAEGKESIPARYIGAKGMVLLVPAAGATADWLFNRIQGLLLEDPLLVDYSQRLMEALLSDLGLQYLVDAAFEMTGHLIYVIDMSYHFLAVSHKGALNEIGSPVLAEENKLGFIVDAGVRQIKKLRLDETVRKSQRPFYFNNVLLGSGSLIDLIKIHDVEIGHIMMYEGDKPFTRLDRALFSRLAAIVSLELQKKRFYKNNRGVMYSYFLADLLNNGAANHQNVGQRLQVMGFALKERLYVMVVDAVSGRIKGEPHMEVIAHQLHWILVGSMYVIHSDRLVLLISRSAPGITEHEYEQAKTYLEENGLAAGVSNCFADIADIQKHYRQALKARELGERVLGKAISHYGETSLFHMFSICEGHESLLHFCSEKLLILLKHDKEHKTEFTRTLYRYLLCSQNSLKTAACLNIHKNTLLYRVEKIKRIADIALDGGEELLELQMSFHILRYLKQI